MTCIVGLENNGHVLIGGDSAGISGEGGYTRTREGREEGGTFLVGIRGRLYCIDSDFQIGRSTDGYMAVGCGDDLALGSLHATPNLPPRTRVKQALKAAAYHSAGVSGPFKVVSA